MNKLLLLTLAVCLSSVAAHDLFATSHPNHFVEKQTIWTWIGDHFKLVFWLISTIIMVPVGAVFSLIGLPSIYSSMYSFVVLKMFKLSSMKTVTEGDDFLFY